jgi:hypothetical protein
MTKHIPILGLAGALTLAAGSAQAFNALELPIKCSQQGITGDNDQEVNCQDHNWWEEARITFKNAAGGVLAVEETLIWFDNHGVIHVFLDGGGSAATFNSRYVGTMATASSILNTPGLRIQVEAKKNGSSTFDLLTDQQLKPTAYAVWAVHSLDSQPLNDAINAEIAARIAGDAAERAYVDGPFHSHIHTDIGTALVQANAYTDTKVAAEATARTTGDANTLAQAKAYTDLVATGGASVSPGPWPVSCPTGQIMQSLAPGTPGVWGCAALPPPPPTAVVGTATAGGVTTTLFDDANVTLRTGTLAGTPGTTTITGYYPLNRFWNNTRSQFIYTAGEMGGAGTITAIRFFQVNAVAATMPFFTIRMRHVSNTAVSAFDESGTIVVNDATLPSTPATAGVWYTVTLATPFAYNGTSNLEIYTRKRCAGAPGTCTTDWISPYPQHQGHSVTSAQQLIYGNSDTLNPPTNVVVATIRPNIQIEKGGPTTQILAATAQAIQFAPKNSAQWAYNTQFLGATGAVTGVASLLTPGTGVFTTIGQLDGTSSRIDARVEQVGGTKAYEFDVFRAGGQITSVARSNDR